MQFSAVYILDGLALNGRTYTEGGLHRPPANAVISSNTRPVIDWWAAVTPRPGEEYSVMELPTPSEHTGYNTEYDPATLYPMRFVHVKLANSTGNKDHVYGWVDDVKVKVMKGQKKVIVVHWHVDWYLTMKDRVQYGAGRILRGPQSLARPDDTPPRKWVFSSKTDIKPAGAKQWGVFLVAKNSRNYLKYFPIGGSIQGSGNCPGEDDIYGGNILTLLEVSSAEALGAWVCPFDPMPQGGTVENKNNKYWYSIPYFGTSAVRRYIDVTETTTDDSTRVVVTNQLGTVFATIPWGTTFDQISIIQDIGVSGANLVISFYKNVTALSPYGPHNLEGRMFTMPLETIPIFGFAKSDYIYSGQRQFDIENASIQRNQAAVNGIAGIGTSAIGGAVAGSMVAPGPGTIAGAVAGAVSGTVGTAVGYASSGHYDAKSQKNTDRLMANQGGSAIISGGGDLWKNSDYSLAIVTSVRDPVSAAELSNEQAELGYLTDSYSTNCTSLINSGGGLKIEELVTYNVTPEASRYIEALFARGVHIDISSP